MAKALARANKLMERSGANRPGATVRLARRSAWALVTGFLLVASLFTGYAVWLKLSERRTAQLAQIKAEQTAVPVVTPTPRPPTPTPVPTELPRDPVLEEALNRIVLNGFRTDPPRILMGGKLYSIGNEILPGLTVKDIEGRTVVAEDAAGAIYRRTF